MTIALAVGLFVVVLIFIIVQPRGLSIGWTAAGGAVVALLLGIVSWSNVGTVVGIVWDATLTFVAVILISMILDAVGFFEWSAVYMIRFARGHGLRLFLLLGVLGALVAMFFANDGAALILTPIVYEQAKALKLDPKATLALIMASGFIADTTSLPLVVSNLVNIVSAGYFHLGFGSYSLRMVPVDVVALAASLGVLYLFYRRDLPGTVATTALPSPGSAIKDPRVFRAAWVVLALLLLGYFASQFLHWPVAIFAGAAAIALLVMAQRSPVVPIGSLIRNAPWKVVVFSIGMYVVVFGLRNVGLTHLLGGVLTVLGSHEAVVGIVGTGVVAAALSSVMNNMPTVLINALAIHDATVGSVLRTAMAYANVVGCDLGPKFTPIGSLATLLWLHVLEQKGVRITWGYYIRVGVTLTIPVLLVTLLALSGWSAVVG
ncbi:MAG: arsenical efflux pump membrane protein ArsB [Sulfobacillus acidophilus]|uniref:Arsenical pump membrane protein n=1 Tax=Sulfobacillus acidophilus TaxID=53633 RepID=A0A2T2WE17_9FIRM|nr:MAG: arsenical efflux pump membrane protein ArsB [Sulfobacillus acidophilus]